MIRLDTRSKMALAEFLINALFQLIPDSHKKKQEIKVALVKWFKKNM